MIHRLRSLRRETSSDELAYSAEGHACFLSIGMTGGVLRESD